MKTRLLMLVAATVVLLTGCIVTSVAPFYTEKDLVEDPRLAGSWTNTTEPQEHWVFERQGTNGFRLTYTTETETNLMEVHHFQVDGQAFLDCSAAELNCNQTPPPIPSHLLLRIYQMTPTLKLAVLSHDWLSAYLKTSPQAVRHYQIKEGEKPTDVRVVLTDDTAPLQRFVLGHLKETNAWEKAFELKKQ